MKPELQKALDDVAELLASAKAEALAARNDALEEAARVCEAFDPEKPSNWLYRREQLPAAIRALKCPHNSR